MYQVGILNYLKKKVSVITGLDLMHARNLEHRCPKQNRTNQLTALVSICHEAHPSDARRKIQRTASKYRLCKTQRLVKVAVQGRLRGRAESWC